MRPGSKWTLLLLIWLMMLVAYLDRIAMAVAGPSVMNGLTLSKAQFGWVLSAFTLGYALTQFPGGRLADRLGSRPLLIAAILVWSLFTFLTGLAWSLVSLLLIRVAFGIGEGFENGAQFKLIGDHFDERERSQASSIFLSALALGPALATPLAAWLIAGLGWRQMFFLFAIPGLAVAALLWTLLPLEPRQRERGTATPIADVLLALRNPACAWSAGGYLLFNATFWGFLGWVPTYLTTQRHMDITKMGMLGTIPYLAGFVGLLASGRLGSTALQGFRPVLTGACYLAAGVFLFLAMKAVSIASCIAGLSATAFFLYGSFGPFWGFAIGLSRPELRGGLTGLVNFFGQVGGFCAQILVGLLADRMHSFQGAIMFMSATSFLGAFAMLLAQFASTRAKPAPNRCDDSPGTRLGIVP